MKLRAGALLLLALQLSTVSASAEYRKYLHTGCTKDHVAVSEQIVWDCAGACATTALKAQIMREAKASRVAYPRVVRAYTKAEIMRRAHASALTSKAHIQSRITADPPKFGGKC